MRERYGGRVIWSGPPPVITDQAHDALTDFQNLFGVEYQPGQNEGLLAPGCQVAFEASLAAVPTQTILTDMLPDHIYPVSPSTDAQVVARVKQHIVGTTRAFPTGGTATFLGFRPRDDQSQSLGYETRTWFEILHALGAYPPTGTFDTNDNPEYLSRTTDYFVCRFPNGTVALANHLRLIEEDWAGTHSRDQTADQAYLQRHPLPPDTISLREFKVNSHAVTYDGAKALAFRANRAGNLIAFAGHATREITINGHTTTFAEKPVEHISWAPIAPNRRVPNGAVMQIFGQTETETTIRIPVPDLPEKITLVAEGTRPGDRGPQIPIQRNNASITFQLTPDLSQSPLYIVPADSTPNQQTLDPNNVE